MLQFVDTSAFYAIEDTSDEDHKSAIDYREKIRYDESIYLITSSYIIDETLTLMKNRLGYDSAIKFGNKVKSSKTLKIIHITQELEEKGWELFVKYKDKEFSFTDCVSFVLMEKYNTTVAFAFDKHFEQYGFQKLP
ncbi:MAG: type II toxin-antitoxin system VapC family toxin [bacterium]|nr:type II toxin-antitoxin system VapC family toxin [bacterium]